MYVIVAEGSSAEPFYQLEPLFCLLQNWVLLEFREELKELFHWGIVALYALQGFLF